MTTAELIKILCKQQNISIAECEKKGTELCKAISAETFEKNALKHFEIIK